MTQPFVSFRFIIAETKINKTQTLHQFRLITNSNFFPSDIAHPSSLIVLLVTNGSTSCNRSERIPFEAGSRCELCWTELQVVSIAIPVKLGERVGEENCSLCVHAARKFSLFPLFVWWRFYSEYLLKSAELGFVWRMRRNGFFFIGSSNESERHNWWRPTFVVSRQNHIRFKNLT